MLYRHLKNAQIELKTGDDPDPAPYLFVSAELKQKIAEKVYDPKRSCYVPHAEEKFCEGIVEGQPAEVASWQDA